MSGARDAIAAVLVAFAVWIPPVHAAQRTCASLASLSLAGGRITSAEEVRSGAFVQPPPNPAPRGAAAAALAGAPPFCRVTATLTPTPDSEIAIEVWLPSSGWNGNFQAVGNGGWAGSFPYPGLAAAVTGGYAAAATDTGHSNEATPGASFAQGHPEKLIDYAHRSLHEMTVGAKTIIGEFYSAAPKLSLWSGCSTGGNQGLTLASKYPTDYDGIIAGASPDPRSRLFSVRLLLNRLVHRSGDSYIPPEKYPAIHAAALKACDKTDGLEDGVIQNPASCRFDPAVLRCRGADAVTCLTAAQVETARLIYSEVKHPRTGRLLYPPLLPPGSELLWNVLAGPQPFPVTVDAFRFLVYEDAQWDPARFDPATDIDRMDKAGAPLDTVSPNLRSFFDRGGKLLMYHGWNDQQVPAMSSIAYFSRLVHAVGRQVVGRSVQLYMVPGMNHCSGGAGTDGFDKVAVMEEWIVRGRAPDAIIASRVRNGKLERTRPLCPYPQIARYKGQGDVNDAGSFGCTVK